VRFVVRAVPRAKRNQPAQSHLSSDSARGGWPRDNSLCPNGHRALLLVNGDAISAGHGAGAKAKRDRAMRDCPVSRELTSGPGAQRAQYYFGTASAGIIDQLGPVSHQSVTLVRCNSGEAATFR
jgi:hypothetical protein